MITFKFRIGDSSGDKARRDTIQAITYAPEIDCFLTAAQKGAISVWNNKVCFYIQQLSCYKFYFFTLTA